jgi:hypothetical protein
MRTAVCLIALAALGGAAELPRYTVRRAVSEIRVDANLDEPAWREAAAAGAFTLLRGQGEAPEPTEVRLLWDDDNLYAGFLCHDRHISAYVTERHGPVSRDDCVEIFISPDPNKVRNYYTFEINAIGAMLNQIRTDWRKGELQWDPDGVRVRATYQGRLRKDEEASDERWVVEMAIPFRNFARDAARIPPRAGDLWRMNLNRTGGITGRQSGSWSPIPAGARGFHTPEAFGWMLFAGAGQDSR